MDRRRFLLTSLAGILATPIAAHAQSLDRTRTIGVLTPAPAQWRETAFKQGLQELGYRIGVNVKLEIRSAGGDLNRMESLARELVTLAPDVIVAVNTPGTRAAVAATKSVPIVMAMVGDPVALGFVSSLARPTGNVTGLSNMAGELAAKRLEILREVVPTATRVALLSHPDEAIVAVQMRQLEAAGRTRRIEFHLLRVRTLRDLVSAFDAAVTWQAHAVLRLAGQASTFGKETAELALRRRLPAMLLTKRDVDAGGLMSYFADDDVGYRRVAHYVDRILRGDSPRDLPIEQPTSFQLTINLKTAKALGIAVPPSLLARADQVIE